MPTILNTLCVVAICDFRHKYTVIAYTNPIQRAITAMLKRKLQQLIKYIYYSNFITITLCETSPEIVYYISGNSIISQL